MLGLFTENGPCTLSNSSDETFPNANSWNNNASVLYLDQPAGTGLSAIKPGTPYSSTDEESAVDFQFFLKTFFGSVFPERSSLPLHLAGESYCGHALPVYVKHILESRHQHSTDAFLGNVKTMILVNAAVDFGDYAMGAYELLCSPRSTAPFNASSCAGMAEAIPKCRKLQSYCEASHEPEICKTAFMYCFEHVGAYYNEEINAGRRSPYNSKSSPYTSLHILPRACTPFNSISGLNQCV